jgi:hypothetical protein
LVTDQGNLILVQVREEGNKAEGLPELDKVKHMLAAGWGVWMRITMRFNSPAVF